MNVAVCFKCGRLKRGAFSACESCGARPRRKEELAASLAMTDHFFPVGKLKRMSAAIGRRELVWLHPRLYDHTLELVRVMLPELRELSARARRGEKIPRLSIPPVDIAEAIVSLTVNVVDDYKPLRGRGDQASGELRSISTATEAVKFADNDWQLSAALSLVAVLQKLGCEKEQVRQSLSTVVDNIDAVWGVPDSDEGTHEARTPEFVSGRFRTRRLDTRDRKNLPRRDPSKH